MYFGDLRESKCQIVPLVECVLLYIFTKHTESRQQAVYELSTLNKCSIIQKKNTGEISTYMENRCSNRWQII